MFVDALTWEKLSEASRKGRAAGHEVRMPKPEHLVALKVHAASSPTRSKRKPTGRMSGRSFESGDWTSLAPEFREIVRRYGGKRLFIE
jgi:hypothetical protein